MKKLFLILFLLTPKLYSHPHLFINPSLELKVENNALKGITFFWEWDKWWSLDVINDCDWDRNGEFNKKETDEIYEYYFSGVKNFNYFTEIEINKKKYKITTVQDFQAFIQGEIVVYKFFVPLESTISEPLNFTVYFNDETIFASFKETKLKGKDLNLSNVNISNHSYYGKKLAFTLSQSQ